MLSREGDVVSLKILIITQGVSRIVKPLFESEHKVVGVLESATRGQAKGWFSGCVWFFIFFMAKLFFNVESLKRYCTKKGVSYRLMRSSQDQGLVTWIRDLAPDVVVVHSMSQLLRDNIYKLPRLGTINLHPSFLPDYRGPNPDFWQYHDVELKPGATVHFINDGEDTGDILFQERIDIPLGMKSPDRSQKIVSELGVSLLLRALDALASGEVQPFAQPISSSTVRARNIKSTEHCDIIKWQEWPVDRIWHVLRGTEQWLDAISQPTGIYKGQRWCVEEFTFGNTQEFKVGAVYKRDGRYLLACRDGVIRLSLSFSIKLFAKSSILYLLKRGSF